MTATASPRKQPSEGGRAWLWQEGWAVTPDLDVDGQDTGDDSMACVDMGVYLTAEHLKALRELLNA